MKKRLTEEVIILFGIFEWIVLATGIGAIAGLAVTAFLRILNWSAVVGNQYAWFYWLLPVALFLSLVATTYFAPDAEGHGTEKVIEAIHRNSGRIKPAVVPIKAVATILTVAAGGSVGKEGPCAQIGGGLSSTLADLLRFDNHDRRKLVICGISAGFAAVFGTPIAGAIFGVEVLFVGALLYDVLLPSFIAGVTSYYVSSSLGVTYFYHPVNFVPVFSESFFLKIILSGIFFGICSFLLIEILSWTKRLAEITPIWKPFKGGIGGIVLIILTLLFSKQYLGLGLETIQSSLQDNPIPWYSPLLKAIFTGVTLGFGGSGGIITPVFFIGSTAGSVLAPVLGLNKGTLSAIGLVSLLAGAANTPIAASIMAVELFGPKIAPYSAVASVVSFLMTGHRSVFPSQVVSMRKSPALQVNIGGVLEGSETRFKFRKRGLLMRTWRIIQMLRSRLPK